MRNNLPEIISSTSRDHPKQTSHKHNHTPPKINVKGITLKEYFRLCDDQGFNHAINQIQQESASGTNTPVETPTFGNQVRNNVRAKIKPQICEVDYEPTFKLNAAKPVFQAHRVPLNDPNRITFDEHQKPSNANQVFNKKKERKKIYTKVNPKSNKAHFEALNRSTLNSFYQVEDNKKKIMRKVEADKQRANQFRLSQAFFITKYGSKFNIDVKNLIKNH